ncbi:MAG: selenide, water dikinase SelD [Cyanobium sp. LacPavin_0920_WC12_MAG_62_9]|nr:selenide, water dikinase SelD [Cyanobium sp. LacPavin_0920_WC12_MAG_62_9]
MTTKQLVLAGGGHSHALVLGLWAMQPKRRPPGLITLVNRHSTALYSGMVPGLVAGLYSPDECAIDLRRLCALTGVTFVQAEITAVDLARQELVLEGRPPLAWDLLSLDVGAEVGVAEGGKSGEGSPGPLPVKPLEPFLAWCHGLEAPQAIAIHGGGAAAVEVALALGHRGLKPSLQLRSEELHLGSRAANRLGESLLKAAGVSIVRNSRKEQALAPASNQEPSPALACTGSRGPSWLEASGLPTNTAGRVLTEASLQVKGLPAVFTCGDCGVIDRNPRAASGVWAVRAAPVLAANLERWLDHSAQQGASAPSPRLQTWSPQARALQLLGDGGAINGRPRAIAFWGPFAWGPSELLWRWKQAIDQRFMEGFTGLQAMASGDAMACHGCGAKLAAAPLAAALEQAGLVGPAEDAAVVGVGANGDTLLQSVDGFPALVGDAWLNARLTTLHACSDLWASGAQVDSVQALVTVPQGPAAMQQQLLAQTLAGVRSVLEPMGGKLIGGHTLEARAGGGMAPGPGPLTLALTVNGSCPGSPWPKGPLHAGDVLVLVKPIGTGVLFAAAMAAAPSDHCKPAWIDQALAQMQQSQAPLVDLLSAHGCRACTDITGFGLLGHLGEMLGASAAPIQVSLDAAALQGLAMAGSLELLDLGYASSLAPSNARSLALLDGPIQLVGPSSAALHGLLIDPQTCGPLLAALPAHQAPAAIAALHAAGFAQAAVVGRVETVVTSPSSRRYSDSPD